MRVSQRVHQGRGDLVLRWRGVCSESSFNRAQDVQLCTSEELHMVIVWPEAERDIDPTGCIRDAVRAGQVTEASVDVFVAREIAENTQLCCSSDQLRDYVLALMANGERTASV